MDELRKLRKKRRHHHHQQHDHQHKNHHHHSDHKSTCYNSKEADLWKKRFHFVDLPVFQFGNWIPYVLNHWQCFGSSCALPQVAIKSKSGKINLILITIFDN
jgi:hypothetical protein